MSIERDLNIDDPDAFYEALVAAHEGLDDEASNLLNARLVMVLANQIGDNATLSACITAAREGLITQSGTETSP